MPLSKDEIKKGIKTSGRDTLEQKILDYLEKAKNTDTPAHSLADMIKAFNVTPREDTIGTFLSTISFTGAINELKKHDKIVEITVKNDTTKYYMVKDEAGIKPIGGLGK